MKYCNECGSPVSDDQDDRANDGSTGSTVGSVAAKVLLAITLVGLGTFGYYWLTKSRRTEHDAESAPATSSNKAETEAESASSMGGADLSYASGQSVVL